MDKIYLCFLFCLLISCKNIKDDSNKELLDSVCEIHIQNRTPDSFRGREEFRVKDKKEVASICKELISLKKENNLPTKPYDGTILIRFLKKDNYGMSEYENKLTTGIIFKPNEYFITNSRGQYVSDHFLARILNYLEIDESKVSALDNYRKSAVIK